MEQNNLGFENVSKMFRHVIGVINKTSENGLNTENSE